MAGIIGALTNNAEGVAGATWSPWILPVRVLGKCGGLDSDIIEAMAWAGGIHVNGVPDNPYPAKIENMSLGSFGPCGAAYASVIGALATRGVLVVVSAGNEGGPVGSPANCAGAAAVTGLRHAGTKVGFASLGPQVAIGAPGGNCVNTAGGPCLFSIDTTYNTGTQTPAAHGYTNQTNVNVGTSFSAPIVSGIAALMAGANGNLNAAQLRARLREGATTPFPQSADPTVPMCHVPTGPNDLQISECNCTTSTCGAGMANAEGALAAALRPIAALSAPATVAAGQTVNLSGAGSAGACNRTIASYFWEVVSGTGVLTGPSNTPTTSVNAPVTGSFTVRLTVTDDVGEQDAADIEIASTSTVTSAPSTAGSNACPVDMSPPLADRDRRIADHGDSRSRQRYSAVHGDRDERAEQPGCHLARRRCRGRQRDRRHDHVRRLVHGAGCGAVACDRDGDGDVDRRSDEIRNRTDHDHGAATAPATGCRQRRAEAAVARDSICCCWCARSLSSRSGADSRGA